MSDNIRGYHLVDIPKGELGQISKILEEAAELQDAASQNCEIMVLLELSDLIGAVHAYLQNKHPSMSLEDLVIMSSITSRAFRAGVRK